MKRGEASLHARRRFESVYPKTFDAALKRNCASQIMPLRKARRRIAKVNVMESTQPGIGHWMSNGYVRYGTTVVTLYYHPPFGSHRG